MRIRFAFALLVAACGTNSHGGTEPDASTTTPDAPPDAGPFAEAAHPSQPVVMNAGGTVLAAPHVVPVFFAGDATAQASLEGFLTAFAQSTAWPAMVQEYGVGALTIVPSVIATETPPTTDSALRTLVSSHAGGTGGWPANTPNTIYAVFLPDGVTISMGGGTSCQQFGGYHSEVQATSGTVAYAAMPRCSSMTFPGLDYVTIATGHELVEAATDPHPQSNPAFASIDDEHAVIQLMPGPELGDMCELGRSAYQPLVGAQYAQRTWSNASAAAGHDPCVPVLATPYVEATAELPDISINGGTTRGVKVPVGGTTTIPVDLFSDAPADDWTVVAVDVASKYQMKPAELELTLDRPTGHNGDKLQLTIKRLAGSQFGASEFMLFSQVGGVTIGISYGLATQ